MANVQQRETLNVHQADPSARVHCGKHLPFASSQTHMSSAFPHQMRRISHCKTTRGAENECCGTPCKQGYPNRTVFWATTRLLVVVHDEERCALGGERRDRRRGGAHPTLANVQKKKFFLAMFCRGLSVAVAPALKARGAARSVLRCGTLVTRSDTPSCGDIPIGATATLSWQATRLDKRVPTGTGLSTGRQDWTVASAR